MFLDFLPHRMHYEYLFSLTLGICGSQSIPKAARLSQMGQTGRCLGNTPAVGAQQCMGHQVKREFLHYMHWSF